MRQKILTSQYLIKVSPNLLADIAYLRQKKIKVARLFRAQISELARTLREQEIQDDLPVTSKKRGVVCHGAQRRD